MRRGCRIPARRSFALRRPGRILVDVSGIEPDGSRYIPGWARALVLLLGSAALTAAIAYLGYHYLRVGDSFARLIMR